MPLLPSRSLVLAHSLACLTISAIFLKKPSVLTSAAPVWVLGEAMHIRETPTFSLPSEPVASLALILAVLAFVESVFAGNLGSIGPSTKRGGASASLHALAERAAILHNAQGQWMMVSAGKALTYGSLVMYSYLAGPRGQGIANVVPVERNAGRFGIGLLSNRITFAAAFTEMLFWGYLWTVLQGEGRELAAEIKKLREERRDKGDEDWLQ